MFIICHLIGKISNEDLFRIYNCRNIEEVYKYISREEIKFAEEVLNSKEKESFFINRMKDDFKGKTPEEIYQDLDDYLNDEASYKYILRAIPDINLVIDRLNTLDDNKKETLVSYIPQEQLIEYINNKGQESDKILNFLVNRNTYRWNSNLLESQANIMESLNSDLDRAKLLLYGGDIVFLPYVEDLYYRNQIVKSKSEYDFKIDDLLSEIEVYDEHKKNISEIKDEKSKAEYISLIEDNDMKQALLETLTEKDNRKIVIDSLERDVDPEIASLDELARTMITEFLEDRLGKNYTDEMKERISIVFNRTNVYLRKLESNVNGNANYIFKSIIISSKHKYNTNRNIGFLIHEYAHIFSNLLYCYTGDSPEFTIEEGMADLFADLVINHYLDKHKNIILDEKKLELISHTLHIADMILRMHGQERC